MILRSVKTDFLHGLIPAAPLRHDSSGWEPLPPRWFGFKTPDAERPGFGPVPYASRRGPTMNDSKSDAYGDGLHAYLLGADLWADNPYPPGSADWQAWRDGWNAAELADD